MVGPTLTPNGAVVWRVAEIERVIAERSHEFAATLPGWAVAAYTELREKLLDSDFPCTFGTVAQRKGEILFAFVSQNRARKGRRALRDALIQFTDLIRPLDSVTASLRPLAVLLGPPRELVTIRQYFNHGWALLRWLHEHDPAPWPSQVPRDPDDPRWSFCFGGIPLFVTFKTPAHAQRRSRRITSAYLILFQAREGFDILAGNNEQGHAIRDSIRRKLVTYDAVPTSSALGYYGVFGNREWRQYFAADNSKPLAVRCPFQKGK
jgi:FPC/CPF motif-containing protein YcgG